MTTRLDRWIASHAMEILVVISVLVLTAGTAIVLIRQHDLQRIERLEKVIRCQDNPDCRRFIHRAIRDHLRRLDVREHEGGDASKPAPPGKRPKPGAKPGDNRGTPKGTKQGPKSRKPQGHAVPTPSPADIAPPGFAPDNGPPPDVQPPGLGRVCELPLPQLPILCN